MTEIVLAPHAVLSTSEADLLAECEAVVERGLQTFVEVGQALASIRDNRLYRVDFSTFEAYCDQRWGISRPRAYELISAARVVSAIADKIESVPTNEAQTRELAPLLAEPEKLREVWNETVERTDGKPTAAAIRAIREEREVPPALEVKPAPTPTPIRPAPPTPAVDPVIAAHNSEPGLAWRNAFSGALVRASHLALFRVEHVVEHADEECIAELGRVVEHLGDYHRRVRAALLAQYGDNVVPLRGVR